MMVPYFTIYIHTYTYTHTHTHIHSHTQAHRNLILRSQFIDINDRGCDIGAHGICKDDSVQGSGGQGGRLHQIVDLQLLGGSRQQSCLRLDVQVCQVGLLVRAQPFHRGDQGLIRAVEVRE